MPSLMKARSGVLNSNIGGNALAPLFSTGSLTTANLITDVTRLAGVEGDGAAYPDSSVGVWPAATNLITNGGFETNTTGWVKNGTGEESLDRVTTTSKFGLACLKVTLGGAVTYDGPRFSSVALTNGTVYTAGAWVKCETGTLALRIQILDALSAILATTTFTATTSWQRVSVTFTANANTPFSPRIINNTSDVSTAVYYVDGVSCYASAIDLPYIETDGGTASRSAGRIQGPASVLSATQMWGIIRVKAGFPASHTGVRLFSWGDTSTNLIEVYYQTGTGWIIRSDATGGDVPAYRTEADAGLAVGDYRTICFGVAAGDINLMASSGVWPVSVARTEVPTIAASQFDIGSRGDITASLEAASGIVWAAFGTGPYSSISPVQAYSWGNNDPLPHMFPKSAQLSFLAHFNGDGTFYRRRA